MRLKSFLKAEIFLARVTSASDLGKARKSKLQWVFVSHLIA